MVADANNQSCSCWTRMVRDKSCRYGLHRPYSLSSHKNYCRYLHWYQCCGHIHRHRMVIWHQNGLLPWRMVAQSKFLLLGNGVLKRRWLLLLEDLGLLYSWEVDNICAMCSMLYCLLRVDKISLTHPDNVFINFCIFSQDFRQICGRFWNIRDKMYYCRIHHARLSRRMDIVYQEFDTGEAQHPRFASLVLILCFYSLWSLRLDSPWVKKAHQCMLPVASAT